MLDFFIWAVILLVLSPFILVILAAVLAVFMFVYAGLMGLISMVAGK